MNINEHNPSGTSEKDAYQAALLLKQLKRDGLTGLNAIRILKIAAFSVEVNVSDAERIARFEKEANKL